MTQTVHSSGQRSNLRRRRSLIGALVVLPFIIAYNVMAYRIFRGKASESLYK